MFDQPRILVVCEPLLLTTLERILPQLRPSWAVVGASSATDARLRLDAGSFDLVLAELSPFSRGGTEVLRYARQRHPEVVRVAHWGNVDAGHEEVRLAHAILACPLSLDDLTFTLDRLLTSRCSGEHPRIPDPLTGTGS